jgi:hypothetical protein
MYAMPTLLGIVVPSSNTSRATDVGSIKKAVLCLNREWNECAGI